MFFEHFFLFLSAVFKEIRGWNFRLCNFFTLFSKLIFSSPSSMDFSPPFFPDEYLFSMIFCVSVAYFRVTESSRSVVINKEKRFSYSPPLHPIPIPYPFVNKHHTFRLRKLSSTTRRQVHMTGTVVQSRKTYPITI